MGEETSKKIPLKLDWAVVLAGNDVEPPPLVIVKGTVPEAPEPCQMTPDHLTECFLSMTDEELDRRIKRQKGNCLNLPDSLPDKGEKLKAHLKALEDERDRRRLRRLEDVEEYKKPVQSTSAGITGASDGFTRESVSSQVNSQSLFGSSFIRKGNENIDCRVANAFDREISTLDHCNPKEIRSKGVFSQRRKKKAQSSSKQWPFLSARTISVNGDNRGPSTGDLRGRASPNHPLCHRGEGMSSSLPKKKDDCQVLMCNSPRHRKGQTVVLVDEDDTQLVEKMELPRKLTKYVKVEKIHYPSRDDPESIEIVYKDIDCLAPEGFLTSPIMNFYIRYLQLQAPSTNKATCDYHFFNTFFYKKLKQAVAYKSVQGSDKESFFVKFRRWWKGVDIFKKAYLLIPIHEDLHWSLVIICIPDKEDESGPILLHLDSLKLHFSKSVFHNVRSFLREEWTYMNQEVVPSDLPIADKIWKNLPRRIDDQVIPVPQQKNDYDCGLFVLFFMKRFIEEAPERLKKKDLAMFGKQWFRPEEASNLREEILSLLVDKFQSPSEES